METIFENNGGTYEIQGDYLLPISLYEMKNNI